MSDSSDRSQSTGIRATLEGKLKTVSNTIANSKQSAQQISNDKNEYYLVNTDSLNNTVDSVCVSSGDLNDDEFLKILNDLRVGEPVQNRVRAFEKLVKLHKTSNLTESSLNDALKLTCDLYKSEQTPFEDRSKSFEYLIQLYLKENNKLESFNSRQLLLTIILSNSKSTKCQFLNILNSQSQINQNNHGQFLFTTSAISNMYSVINNINNQSCISATTTNTPNNSTSIRAVQDDDIKLRFELFNLIVSDGKNCKNLDPELISECLIFFLENAKQIDNILKILELFYNFLDQKYFLYFDEQILRLLTRYILNYSFVVTNEMVTNGPSPKLLNELQLKEIRACVQLIEKLIDHLADIASINHVVLCLCELIDLANNTIPKDSMVSVTLIYECMKKLLVSRIGSCAVYTFFSEIFPNSKKFQVHKWHQINGALLHIKLIFDDFRQSKLKNIHLIKDLHLNLLIHLPSVIKMSFNDLNNQQKTSMINQILNLTIDLVHLPVHRDLLMSFLNLNSRKFLLEIVNQLFSLVLDDDLLLRKYADLLNLIDKKDVFSYKTSKETGSGGSTNPQILNSSHAILNSKSGNSLYSNVRNANNLSLQKDGNMDEASLVLQKFKESFLELIYKFPNPSYLKENSVINCIDYYLQRKLLPRHKNQAIKEMKALMEKYFCLKNNYSLSVRKFAVDVLHRKLKDYLSDDQKMFTEEVIEMVLLPLFEEVILEEDAHYQSLKKNSQNQEWTAYLDLFDVKSFIVNKLVDLQQMCNDERNILKIVQIYEKIMSLEEKSSVELLIPISNIIIQSSISSTSSSSVTSSSSQQNAANTNSALNSSHSANSPLTTNPTYLFYVSLTSPNVQSPNILNYINKIINHGLMELFERHFSCSAKSNPFSNCTKLIYNILTDYLDMYYSKISNQQASPPSNSVSTLSNLASESLIVQQAQFNPKFFNYYAAIRRDIFEFLLRIRSDKNGRVLFVNRLNKRKYLESRHLLLTLKETKITSETSNQDNEMYKCQLDFGKILKLIDQCLDKEIDWNVIMTVLADLPYVLQYEMDLIQNSSFTNQLFRHFFKKEINLLRNKPDGISKIDYMNRFYPLMASLILYHKMLERSAQENILQNFSHAINSTRNRFCLEILTIAITEMHESNLTQCSDILLKLSHLSASQSMAQPVLELLSTISDFKKMDTTFSRKDFISVAAIAIKYTDPLKFNSFIILLAHYVICIWFIKCKPDLRKSYASFICKGLHQEVIVQLERLNANTGSIKDVKSPNKLNDEGSNQTLNQSPSSSNLLKREKTMSFVSDENKNLKNNLTESMKAFYRELVEITMDFMSNNMFFNSSPSISQIASSNNRNEFMVDIYPNGSSNGAIRSSSLFESGKDTKNKGQSRHWLVGNKIIQVTTGLFSNICLEEPNSFVSRKNRNSNSTSSANSKQKKSTPAIDIPGNTGKVVNNDSMASSNNSSTSASNNNSYSSVSLHSASQKIEQEVNKVEQEYFDETIDGKDAKDISNQVNNPDNGFSGRKNRLMKRRYKSGLPLTTDRNEEDILEETYLKMMSESNANKQSKDDSAIISDLSLVPGVCCLRNGSDDGNNGGHNLNCSLMNQVVGSQSNHQILSRNNSSSSHLCHDCRHKREQNKLKVGNNGDPESAVKELCHPSCWCNNLVEITCRYPTKVVTYVSLIENNNYSSHYLNMSIFDKYIKLRQISDVATELSGSLELSSSVNSSCKSNTEPLFTRQNGFGVYKNDPINGGKQSVSAQNLSHTALAANAIELRRNSSLLSRISESSMLQDASNQADQSAKVDDKPAHDAQIPANQLQRRSSLTRKSSFDFSNMKETITNIITPKQDLNASLTNFKTKQETKPIEISNQNQLVQSQASTATTHSGSPKIMPNFSNQIVPTGLDPSQVFLHLFQTQHSYSNEKEQPLLIPENESIQRSMNILDYIPCYMVHKIGVLYIGRSQTGDEKTILFNAQGSVRYRNFINGLGNLIHLKDMDTIRFYPGGLETDGSAGDFSLLWFDGITQVLFHVATMMVLKDCVSKKRHIGNDSTIIVYNESGEEYKFNMIKGDVNCMCIEIIPLKSNTNIVKVKTTNEIAQSGMFVHNDPKFVSDQNLSLVVRKMALHADIASKVYRSQKDSNLYGGKWYERLKQINRIKKLAKEQHGKQAAQPQQQMKNYTDQMPKTPASNTGYPSAGLPISTTGQLDFTDYI